MRARTLLLLLALAPAAAGCAGMLSQMAVPAELSAAPDWEVRGLQGWNAGSSLRFGSFRVERVRRGDSFREGLTRAVRDAVLDRVDTGPEGAAELPQDARATERLRFHLRDGEGEPWAADCSQSASLRRLDLPVLGEVMQGQRETMLCRFAAPGEEDWAWDLEVGTRRGRTSGRLARGDVRFAIRSSDRMDNSRLRGGAVTGYVLLAEGRPVAMADVLNGGRVRIDPALDAETRGAVAATAAALLLRGDLIRELEQQ